MAGFATRGASFRHEAGTSDVVFRAGQQGVAWSGIYFWHDYRRSSFAALDSDWSSATPAVNAKYAFIWQRFLEELSDPGEKTFVIATTQANLVEFAKDERDFANSFELDGQFIDELASALGEVCSDDFSMLAFVRGPKEADAIRAGSSFGRLVVQNCGPLPLRVHQPIVDFIRNDQSFNS